ncbi:DUF192 domain-containing protein [Cypionkella sp.]|uniref:DUF192 domain-containing protein n=1 Tax=Cypionkella sp. TaxID=2811411 RepID=UPI0026123062|nr:DUF192 domain-containing protein [Cypionkella sp.]MDB5665438.1 hypothetical protein [Cypionkella sp.]
MPNTVELRGPAGVQRFSVEIADTEAERSQGLMFREKMPASSGMLFVYDEPKHAYFWMKNTLLPLDMVFADRTGLVTAVHSNAAPQDETPIDGGPGVAIVLEINGGLAKRMGIAPGAVMRSAALDQSLAAWGCDE